MIADWLAREGWIVLSWWLLASLAGAAALPLTFSLFRSLPDRGYTLARALGLVADGLHFLAGNQPRADDQHARQHGAGLADSGGLCSAALYLRRVQDSDWRGWWRANRRFILFAELLFLVALLALALLRAHNNSLHGTEKPMELAFLSATQRSASFPPADPWFSGHAISYYYFGYVLMAMLASLSGIGSTLAFNMSIAIALCVGRPDSLWRRRQPGARTGPGRTGRRSGLLGACFVCTTRQLAAATHRIALANWPRHGCLVRVLGPA